MKKNIGIVTFHCANNYGAFLQAFALQQWLKKNTDNNISIVNYCPDYLLECYKIKFPQNKNIKNIIIFLYEMPSKLVKIYRFKKARKKLNLSDEYKKSRNYYSYLILGSDQIWNPEITNGIDEMYYGTFSDNNCQRISYAASIGVNSFSISQQEKLKILINNLNAVSVREKTTISVLNSIIKKKMYLVCDPTFLLSKKEWISACSNIKYSNYIVIYQLFSNPAILQDAVEYAKKYNKSILLFNEPMIKNNYGVKIISVHGSGPFEFISIIKNADLVLTNSFHATCFSIIFQKEFYTYLQEQRSQRIRDLAIEGDFLDHLVEYGNHLKLKKELDFKMINNNLDELIRNSKKFLYENLDIKEILNEIKN